MSSNITGKLHCPNPECGKPILSHVALAEGSTFVMLCPKCRVFIRIIATFSFVEKKILKNITDRDIISLEGKSNGL